MQEHKKLIFIFLGIVISCFFQASGQNKPTLRGSLLASGDWYNLGVTQTGIYKLDYNFMKSIGLNNPSDLNKVKIYGSPGGMLSQLNSVPRDTDLVQNAVELVMPNGIPDASSYILFYAKGPTSWAYDPGTKHFHHQINYYSDVSCYFITLNGDILHPAKRIQDAQSIVGAVTNEITSFDAYDYHELDTITALTLAVKSGREWFGESFDGFNNPTLRHSINFNFPQADLTKGNTYIRTSTAARSFPDGSSFDFSLDNGNSYILRNSVGNVYSYDDFDYEYANVNDNSSLTIPTPASNFAVQVKFSPGDPNAGLGWLNYVEFNVESQLKYIKGPFSFRNSSSDTLEIINNDTLKRINRYHITGAPTNNYQVWDVTDFHNVVIEPLTNLNNEATFLSFGDVLREFVSSDGYNYPTPRLFGKIANQDLHSLPQADMVIVTYPDFIPAADSIAAYHRQHDNLDVNIVTPEQVYNEFSSGTQDVTAIRDMIKMFYDRGSNGGKSPKFILLIGAASFDYKGRIANNTNLVPVYEGTESVYAANSFCSDDYYTLVANGEGAWPDGTSEILQLSVGRLPVYTLQQAMDIYHKMVRYNDPKNMGDWRNRVCFIADDRENNTFVEQVQELTDGIVTPQHPELNIKKLYLDATPEENTPAGQLFPQINEAINQNVNSGCLIMNYIGHGGQLGWAHEKVLTIQDIQSWNNKYNMPFIISATCQLSTFDDPSNISAGQLALFNPNGGPFALLTTTREVEIDANMALNRSVIFNNLFEKINGKPKFIGDVFQQGKNSIQNPNSSNFALLGDPAIRLALPEYDIKVDKILIDKLPSDTLKALSLVTISGEIVSGGQRISNFNGDIYPTVYDKIEVKHTLGQAQNDPNDPDSPIAFNTQENIIYKGPASVDSGKFTFQFVIPKDISFDFGKGKLSFYADNGLIDASGYSDSIVIGGSDDNAIISHQPPSVRLFMNDTNFVTGGIVNNNPSLVARVRSNLGINTLGDIGHDLTATLSKTDDQNVTDNTVILDNFYTADKNSYQSGTITYPFSNLADGHYSLNVRVWDVANNTAEATTDFVVINSSKLTIDNLFNYPNPFTDETTFKFDHNRPNEALNVDISIYDLNGKLVRDMKSDISSAGDNQAVIHWNGTETGGAKIAPGLYVYELIVKSQDGQIAQKSQKLILIK